MKNPLKRILSLGLSVSVALGLSIPPASASEALGSDRMGSTTQLAAGTTLTENSLWSATYSDLRTEYYLTYTPNTAVTPLLRYGSRVPAKETLTSGAKQLQEQGYRVIGGVNGGFFNPDGTPVGLLLTDGVVRSIDRWNYTMVGFLPDGTAFVDKNAVTKTVRWTDANGQTMQMAVAAINGSRDNNGVYLYNEDFGTSTNNSLTGVDVVLQPVTAGQKPVMNGSMEFQVVQVVDSTKEGVAAHKTIPAGGYVLTANKNSDASILDPMRALTPGTQVTVTLASADSRWNQAVCGFTGLYTLVENGQVAPDLAKGANPRTALGLKADGSVVFYAIDGRQAYYSIGATYTQTAKRLIELGCVTALALDGGGSTTLGATMPGTKTFTMLNRPSGGTQRAVSDSLFLVTKEPSSEVADRYYVDSERDIVFTGGHTYLAAAVVDVNGYAVPAPGGSSWTSDGGNLAIDEQGRAVFTAGAEAGKFTVNVWSEGLTGSTPVRVVDALSWLSLSRKDTGAEVSKLSLKAGDTVDLDGKGSWYNLPVALDDSNITWTVEGGVGTVDANGLFTAGNDSASGAVVASAGGRTVRVSVQVQSNDHFTDIAGHWSREYIRQIYKMGLTTGVAQPDGTFQYLPDAQLTRQEVLTFISRLLGADTSLYGGVELPFADAAQIPGWVLPHVKTLYALDIFKGVSRDGAVFADMNTPLSREMVIAMLGRLLQEQAESDLSVFPDADKIGEWAAPYVQTMLAHGILSGGKPLEPQGIMTRGELAMFLVKVSALPLLEPVPAQS